MVDDTTIDEIEEQMDDEAPTETTSITLEPEIDAEHAQFIDELEDAGVEDITEIVSRSMEVSRATENTIHQIRQQLKYSPEADE